MKSLIGIFKKFAGLFGLSQEVKTESDVEATIQNPSVSNVDADIADFEAEFEKYFPQIPAAKVEAVGAILDSAAPLIEARSTHNIEVFGASIVHELPNFGVHDAPLDDATKAALASCNSTLDALSIVIQAALAVEGIS